MTEEFNNLFENPVGVAFGAKPIFKKNKMKEEFNLSEKMKYLGTGRNSDDEIFKSKDVKEFIKKLKEFIMITVPLEDLSIKEICEEIDKLAGEKLI